MRMSDTHLVTRRIAIDPMLDAPSRGGAWQLAFDRPCAVHCALVVEQRVELEQCRHAHALTRSLQHLQLFVACCFPSASRA